ncbi:MAG: hypothetical protein GY842_20620, partial [bacterium]|nr:hypothetical protein [bacterium]
MAVGLGVVGCAFLSGMYVRARHWDWAVQRRVQTAVAATHAQLESVLYAEPLPVISLDVKFKHMAKLRAQRDRALEDEYLRTCELDFVPARLQYDGASVRVKVRLKGDRLDHLAGDKWSIRVKVRDDQRPFGMRSFSLHHPGMRWYLNEWCFLESVRREGLMAVRYQFVRLVLNGEDKGIYALEEHFSKELLETHERREGVVVALEEQTAIHIDTFRRGHSWKDWEVTTRLSAVRSQEVRTFDTQHLEDDPALRSQRDEAVELLRAYQEGRRKATEVFDVRLLARYMALVDLWQAWHAVLWGNTRYYYNPVTARLEPIGFDAMALWGDHSGALMASRTDDRYINGPLREPEIARVYLEELERISQPEYLADMRAALEPQCARWRLALQGEFPLEHQIDSAWQRVEHRQRFLRSAINPPRMVTASAVREPNRQSVSGNAARYTVDVRSVALLPVEITSFYVNGEQLCSAEEAWVQRRQKGVWRTGCGAVGLCPSDPERPAMIVTFN